MTCTRCGKPGEPYEYNGRTFDGLVADRGERVHGACRSIELAPIRETVGLHTWLHDAADDRAPLLPFALAGEVAKVRRRRR